MGEPGKDEMYLVLFGTADELLLPRFQHLVATQPQPGFDTGFEAVIEGGGAKSLLDFTANVRFEPGSIAIE
jgi:hypothetical protein